MLPLRAESVKGDRNNARSKTDRNVDDHRMPFDLYLLHGSMNFTLLGEGYLLLNMRASSSNDVA